MLGRLTINSAAVFIYSPPYFSRSSSEGVQWCKTAKRGEGGRILVHHYETETCET